MADASTNYSFIDVAAWDGVRENFLSGRPIAVFSADMHAHGLSEASSPCMRPVASLAALRTTPC